MPSSRDLLVQEIRDRRTLFVVGTGVSIAATGNAPCASWTGLIKNGLIHCADLMSWTEERLAHELRGLELAQTTDDLIRIASLVESTLTRQSRAGGAWGRWLREAVGTLTITHAHELVNVLHVLGQGRLATCNYDDILTRPDIGMRAIPWTRPDLVVRVLRGEDRGVIHLHGHWETPESIIFGSRSYEDVIRSEAAQAVQRAITTRDVLVFVGFGSGLDDPNFGPLLDWFGNALADVETPHFLLLREPDVAPAQAHFQARGIQPISYGPEHSNLTPFLQSLALDAGLDISPTVRVETPHSPPQADVQTPSPAQSARTPTPPPLVPRNAFAQRLGDSWMELANQLGIPDHTRRRWPHGGEADAIWRWLTECGRFDQLPDALRAIGRDDLADLLAS